MSPPDFWSAICLVPFQHSDSTREAFTSNLNQTLAMIASHIRKRMSDEDRRKIAMSIFATIMGALQLSRAVNDPALSDEIMEAGISAACRLAKG